MGLALFFLDFAAFIVCMSVVNWLDKSKKLKNGFIMFLYLLILVTFSLTSVFVLLMAQGE